MSSGGLSHQTVLLFFWILFEARKFVEICFAHLENSLKVSICQMHLQLCYHTISENKLLFFSKISGIFIVTFLEIL